MFIIDSLISRTKDCQYIVYVTFRQIIGNLCVLRYKIDCGIINIVTKLYSFDNITKMWCSILKSKEK